MARWEMALGIAIVAFGAWLRTIHLATPSLWWDELIHLRTATLPDLLSVIRVAWRGVMPESGNAGAVPLDYVLLHLWLRFVPHPGPAWLEVYYRVPAWASSVLSPAVLWLGFRSIVGAPAALIGAATLAGSVFLACYAAEARFYSTLVLATLVQVAVFARLAVAPHEARWWRWFVVTTVLVTMTGLYGALVVVVEYAVLLVVSARAWVSRGDRRVFGRLLGTGLVMGAAMVGYLIGAGVGVKYARMIVRYPGPFGQIPASFTMFAGFVTWLGWALAMASPMAFVVAWLWRPALRSLATVCAGSLLAIPAIVEVSYWKFYYYHPRHAVFLIPLAVVAVGIVVAAIGDRLSRRPAWVALGGVLLVVGVQGPTIRRFVVNPFAYFGVSKTERDYRGFVTVLHERIATMNPRDQLLLLVERNKPGYLGNPVLGFYLKEWGLTSRVVLRGFADPMATLARVRTECPPQCVGLLGTDFDEKLGAGDPYSQGIFLRGFLGLGGQARRFPSWIGGTNVLIYADTGKANQAGFRRTPFRGFAVFEPQPTIAGAAAP